MNNDTSHLTKVTGLSKVLFELEDSEWHDHATETLWASPQGENKYRIENVPFYVYGVSFDDVVDTKQVEGQNIFQSVALRGGHSTYRIFLSGDTSHETFEKAWSELKALGCTYERATDYLLAVDVPPPTDIYKAYEVLEKGLKIGVWDFEEGHCGHPLNK